MKSEIVATVVGGIVTVAVLGFCFLAEKDEREQEVKAAQFVSVGGTDEVVQHDWECKFCIEDGYNGNGKDLKHYVNDYKRNTNHSITFVGEDGLLTTIPYPYFQIIPNPKPKKETEL